MNTVEKTMQTTADALTAEGLIFDLLNDGTAIRTGYRDETGTFETLILGREEPHHLVVIILIPLIVPEAKRAAMAEAVVRANYGAPLGKFELSMTSGVMRHVAALPLSDAVMTGEQFLSVFATSIARTTQYARAFARLIFADDLSPAEVIAEVELQEEHDKAPSPGRARRRGRHSA